jgi:hypothetical protein
MRSSCCQQLVDYHEIQQGGHAIEDDTVKWRTFKLLRSKKPLVQCRKEDLPPEVKRLARKGSHLPPFSAEWFNILKHRNKDTIHIAH